MYMIILCTHYSHSVGSNTTWCLLEQQYLRSSFSPHLLSSKTFVNKCFVVSVKPPDSRSVWRSLVSWHPAIQCGWEWFGHPSSPNAGFTNRISKSGNNFKAFIIEDADWLLIWLFFQNVIQLPKLGKYWVKNKVKSGLTSSKQEFNNIGIEATEDSPELQTRR